MAQKKIIIGSRRSPLALVQVKEILSMPELKAARLRTELVTFHTAGDRDKKASLIKGAADDFFTDEIDQALVKGAIDIAIHSAKDLPQQLNPKLEIFALTRSIDDTDAWVGPLPFAQLPKGAKIGTSSLLRQQSIKAIRPDVRLVDIRGTIQERLNLIWDGKIDGVIVATCALKRLSLDGLIKDIFPWEGTPLQGQLAVVGRRDNHQLKKIFQAIDVRRSYGSVVLVGAGPGDAQLITVKGVNALKEADCVFYDYLADPALLSYAPRAEHIYVGKRKGCHALTQAELSRQLRVKAMEGKKVVRLKGGDPLVFGRGADEILYLRSYHIGVSVIPGVSSATGIASSLGIPLTVRGTSSAVSFVSGHGENKDDDRIRIPDSDTIVFLMGLSRISQIVREFRRKKWLPTTPVMVISKGTRKDQAIISGTLQTIERLIQTEKPQPPALIIVGETVKFYQPPQSMRTILFLGTHPEHYRSLGVILHRPMIKIEPVKFSDKAKKDFFMQIAECDLILLTSEYAVEQLFRLFPIDDLKAKTYAVIGSHTAQALLNRDVHPKFVATDETSEGLFKELKRRMQLKGASIVFPRSALPNPFLRTALTKAGAKVAEVAVYNNTKPSKRPLPKEPVDAVIFTSPSTVVNFIKDYGTIPSSWEILCKGPVSLKKLNEFGYQAKIISN